MKTYAFYMEKGKKMMIRIAISLIAACMVTLSNTSAQVVDLPADRGTLNLDNGLEISI